MSSLESVMITAFAVPLAAGLFWIAVEICHYLYQLMSTLIGWPYL